MHTITATLLIPCLLLGQTVGVAHVHTGGTESAAEHAARPHVHLHGHGDHSHPHIHSHVDVVSDETNQTTSETGLREASEHDADAVYGIGAAAATPRKDDSVFAKAFPIVIPFLPTIGLTQRQDAPFLRRWRPPDDQSAKRPLYLRICFFRC